MLITEVAAAAARRKVGPSRAGRVEQITNVNNAVLGQRYEPSRRLGQSAHRHLAHGSGVDVTAVIGADHSQLGQARLSCAAIDTHLVAESVAEQGDFDQPVVAAALTADAANVTGHHIADDGRKCRVIRSHEKTITLTIANRLDDYHYLRDATRHG